jgi:hypothetical protein
LLDSAPLINDEWLRYTTYPCSGGGGGEDPCGYTWWQLGERQKERRRKAQSTMGVQLLQQILVWPQRHAGESHYSLFIVHAANGSSPVYAPREHLSGVKAASLDIVACKSSPLEVRAQMVAEMASKLVKGTAKIKRAGDTQEDNDGTVADAAKDVASKRSRFSASTGDIKGLHPGTASNERNHALGRPF